jgi:hypothetical protein
MLSMVIKAHLSILQVPQVVSTVVHPIYRVPCPRSCGPSLFVCVIRFELFAIIRSNPDQLLTSQELQNIDIGLFLPCLYVRLID